MCIKCTQGLSRSLREKLFMEACKQEGELERTKKRKKKKERDESMDRKGKLEKESQVFFDKVCPQMPCYAPDHDDWRQNFFF